MGSWNGTCTVSHLPIGWRDKAVAVAIKPKPTYGAITEEERFLPSLGSGFSYASDVYEIFPIPIFGTYDSHGSLEDVEEDKNVKAITGMSTQDFVSKCERDPETNKRWDYCLCLIKRNVWDHLLEAKGGTETLWGRDRGSLEDQVLHIMTALHFHEEMLGPSEFNLEAFSLKEDIKNYLFGHNMLFESESSWKVQKLIEDNFDEDLIRKVLYLRKINDEMEDLRRGWFPQIGAGSQARQFLKHKSLAKLVQDDADAYISEWKKENEGEYEDFW
jgi:hypothetical protein